MSTKHEEVGRTIFHVVREGDHNFHVYLIFNTIKGGESEKIDNGPSQIDAPKLLVNMIVSLTAPKMTTFTVHSSNS